MTLALDRHKAVIQWLTHGKTGLSSKTMAFAFLSQVYVCYGMCAPYPHDPGDLSRCVKLVDALPEVREAFPMIRGLSPQWEAVIDNWDELTQLLKEELPSGRAPKTYERMKELGL